MGGAAPRVLVVAGSDPSGGAGLQADLATLARLGVAGTAAVTAITVQTSREVRAIHPVPAELVRAQIEAAFDEAPVAAVKLGLQPRARIIRQVAEALRIRRPSRVVLDPVAGASSGRRFLGEGAIGALRDELVPLVDLIAPNLPEAGILLGRPVPTDRARMEEAAEALLGLGARAALLKGGHLPGPASPDLLATPQGLVWLEGREGLAGGRGTGCRLTAAVAAFLARGEPLAVAATRGKAFVERYLATTEG